MLNYIQADLYRLFHKKSNYIFYGVLYAAFIALVTLTYTAFEQGEGFTNGFVELAGVLLTQLFPLIFGVQAFSTVFLNDVSANGYQNIFSSGLSKVEFVLSKLMIMFTYMLITFLSGIVVYLGFYGVLLLLEGGEIYYEGFQKVAVMTLNVFLGLIGYAMVASVVAFFTQNTTITLITFVALISNMVLTILNLAGLATDKLEFLREYTLSHHLSQSNDTLVSQLIVPDSGFSIPFETWGVILIYIVVASVLGILVLNKVEIKEGK